MSIETIDREQVDVTNNVKQPIAHEKQKRTNARNSFIQLQQFTPVDRVSSIFICSLLVHCVHKAH